MQQLLVMGAVSKLPEEVQWNVRVLLPRKEEPAAAAAKAAQAAAGPPVVQFPGLHMPIQQVRIILAPDVFQRGEMQTSRQSKAS